MERYIESERECPSSLRLHPPPQRHSGTDEAGWGGQWGEAEAEGGAKGIHAVVSSGPAWRSGLPASFPMARAARTDTCRYPHELYTPNGRSCPPCSPRLCLCPTHPRHTWLCRRLTSPRRASHAPHVVSRKGSLYTQRAPHQYRLPLHLSWAGKIYCPRCYFTYLLQIQSTTDIHTGNSNTRPPPPAPFQPPLPSINAFRMLKQNLTQACARERARAHTHNIT